MMHPVWCGPCSSPYALLPTSHAQMCVRCILLAAQHKLREASSLSKGGSIVPASDLAREAALVQVSTAGGGGGGGGGSAVRGKAGVGGGIGGGSGGTYITL